MKSITIRVWVPDETPTAAIDGTRANVPVVRDWLLTLDQEHTDVQQLTEEEIKKIGAGIDAREYSETVKGIVEDLKRAIKDGEIADRDAAMDWLHDTIDGHHDVIYTYAAQNVVRQSRNDGAYFEQMGESGAVQDGAINWSGLAYCALEADVLEEIGDLDDLFAADDESDNESETGEDNETE